MMAAIQSQHRSGVIIPIRLPPALEVIRMREVASARAGAPAHVTVLFPFVPVAELRDRRLRRRFRLGSR